MAAKKTPAPAASLPNAEIKALAVIAKGAWDGGSPVETEDTEGGLWLFEPIRDGNMRLHMERLFPDRERVTRSTVTALEFGSEAILPVIASRLLAMVHPA